MAHPPTNTRFTPPLPKAPIRTLTRPVRKFLRIESASGVVLVACTVVAMGLANSRYAEAFHDFWETPVMVGAGAFELRESLHFWVNDALMTLFFFVVGLEIKRELVVGELSTVRKAALPAVAALGGMVVPALVYALLNPGGDAARGWGVPMATDIAFVVGVMTVIGPRVPFGLKIFLLALAIVDDLGAIVVIAVGYSGSPDFAALGAAAGGIVLTVTMNKLGVRSVPAYLVVGAGVWLAVLKSGVHPTIAGVGLGLLTPTGAWISLEMLRDALSTALGRVEEAPPGPADLDRLAFVAKEAASPLDRLVDHLHPWVGFVIMPVFALANAGVHVVPAAVLDPVAVAVAVGLVVGKPVGIVLFSLAAVKLGVASLPTGVTWRMMLAAGCLGGIGFTMALFVAQLAFAGHPEMLDAGKVGILTGSLASAVLGSVLLILALPKARPDAA